MEYTLRKFEFFSFNDLTSSLNLDELEDCIEQFKRACPVDLDDKKLRYKDKDFHEPLFEDLKYVCLAPGAIAHPRRTDGKMPLINFGLLPTKKIIQPSVKTEDEPWQALLKNYSFQQ
jgi:hypothetical protein